MGNRNKVIQLLIVMPDPTISWIVHAISNSDSEESKHRGYIQNYNQKVNNLTSNIMVKMSRK